LNGAGADTAGVLIDDTGTALPPYPSFLVQRLGCPVGDLDAMAHAIRNLGFIYLASMRGGLLVKFEPSTVRPLAAIAAFYEIAGRAPKRLILAYPGKSGEPDRYEILLDLSEGLKRLEAAYEARRDADGQAPAPSRPVSTEPARRAGRAAPAPRQSPKGGRVIRLWRPDGLAIKRRAEDSSARLGLPLESIAAEDEWLGQLLNIWRNARTGWRLPGSESLDPLEILNIARGRAHIVDTRDSDPAGYRFRLWAKANPYRGEYKNQTLAQMPAGLMREDAIEDYSEVAATGVPTYRLIYRTEHDQLLSYARLLLPLAADGRRVDQLLVLINERRLRELETP
jgi:hypothetical protein